MKIKTAVTTVVPIGVGLVVGTVAPTILLSFLSAEAGYGALLCTIAFFGGEWLIAPTCVASTVLVGVAAGGGAYAVSHNVIDNCMNLFDQVEVTLNGEHSHNE